MKRLIMVAGLFLGPFAFAQTTVVINAKLTGTGDRTAWLQNLLNSGKRDLRLEGNFTITVNGFLDAKGKTVRFANGAKMSGTGTLANAYIKAPASVQIFDTSLSLCRLSNRTIQASWFGFLSKAPAVQNTKAVQRISALINSASGGFKLMIGAGLYDVGKENFAGAVGKGFAYMGEQMFHLQGCHKPVVIEGKGAVIRLAPRMHFGAFNPLNGKSYRPKDGGFYELDYRSFPQSIFEFYNNASITVKWLRVDGNSLQSILGGYYGDTGFQLPGDAITAIDNDELTLEGVTTYAALRDGLLVGNSPKAGITKKINISNCHFDGSGRQGLSWTGGNHLECVNCSFTNTGKTINIGTGMPCYSAPGAGIDVEAEQGPISNGLFDGIYVFNNEGAGFVNDNAISTADLTIKNSTVIGSTSVSLFGLSKRMKWIDCIIAGQGVSFHTAGSKGLDDADNASFDRCLFTMDTTVSPNGKIYGSWLLDLGGGGQGTFRNCVFNSAHRASVYDGYQFKFYDCTFIQDSVRHGLLPGSYLHGFFFGTTNLFTVYGGVPMNPILSEDKLNGPFYINETLLSATPNLVINPRVDLVKTVLLRSNNSQFIYQYRATKTDWIMISSRARTSLSIRR